MTKCQIVYLDDEQQITSLARTYLQSQGYEVHVFHHEEALIAHCAEHRPDLAFIDYRLVDTRGDIVAQRMDPDIPKVMVTGELNADTDYEFDEVVLKPYKMSDLPGIINRIVAS